MKYASALLSLTSLASLVSAYPVQVEVNARFPPLGGSAFNFWAGPGPQDSRGPCPALNTLANHGYINRSGRDITADTIFKGFFTAFGMNTSAVAPALPNTYHTCQYLTGQDCAAKTTIANLSLLAEPHAAEHDHSLSRQDYKMAWAHGKQTDNNNFNATIFQQVLDLIRARTHVDYALANQIRLMRTSNAIQDDQPGWISPEGDIKPVQAFEMGFIFAVMSDPSLPDYATNPQIRVDWWHYWFANEALPYALGWKAPSPAREIGFVAAAAGAIYSATPAAVPLPLPSGALGVAGAPAELPATATIPILPLSTEKPYSPWPFWTGF